MQNSVHKIVITYFPLQKMRVGPRTGIPKMSICCLKDQRRSNIQKDWGVVWFYIVHATHTKKDVNGVKCLDQFEYQKKKFLRQAKGSYGQRGSKGFVSQNCEIKNEGEFII